MQTAILYPCFALAAWTFLILLLLAFTRIRAGLTGKVNVGDFRLGESAAVPVRVSLPNRNYMNLLELPVLFYVVCLIYVVTQQGTATQLKLAWLYVILRILHSIVHLGYNNVYHRLIVFTASNGVLIALWALALGGLK